MKCSEFIPLKGQIFVTNLEEGARITTGGIILADDHRENRGIRQRWGEVIFVGEDVDYVKPGEWILLPHGRWTLRLPIEFENGETVDVWKVDNDAILLVADERPSWLGEVNVKFESIRGK